MIIIALMLITCGIQNIQYHYVILESLNNHNTYVIHELLFFINHIIWNVINLLDIYIYIYIYI
jgi:hypothetical protein